MRRLVIGCGYLGRRVAARWIAAGDSVFALTRSPTNGRSLKAAGIDPIFGDVLDAGGICWPEVDSVFYAVGFDRGGTASRREVVVGGLDNVLATLPTVPLVYVSSTSVYGQSSGEWIDERTPAEPTNESGRLCLEAERLLAPRAVCSILRLSGIYGPGRLLRRRTQLEQGEPIPGRPDAYLNLIHVDDAAAVAVQITAMDQLPDCLLVSDGRPPSRAEFYGRLCDLLSLSAPRFDPELPSRSIGMNKRVRNDRLMALMGDLIYPSFIEGLPHVIA